MPDYPEFDSFGPRLAWWRLKRGIKRQGDLAERISISQPSLSELESGKSKEPSATVLLKLAAELRLRPRYLLLGEGPAEGQYFQELSGPEAQLVMIFRQLTEAMRDGLLIDANNALARVVAQNPAGSVGISASRRAPIEEHSSKALPDRKVPRSTEPVLRSLVAAGIPDAEDQQDVGALPQAVHRKASKRTR